MPTVHIDGSYYEGFGGCAAIIVLPRSQHRNRRQVLSQGGRTSNSTHAELLGLLLALDTIAALRAIALDHPAAANVRRTDVWTIHADHKLLVDAWNGLIDHWRSRQWRRSTGNARVKHADLWQKIARLRNDLRHVVQLAHIAGHRGDPLNNAADHAAAVAARYARRGTQPDTPALTVDRRGNQYKSPTLAWLTPIPPPLPEHIPEPQSTAAIDRQNLDAWAAWGGRVKIGYRNGRSHSGWITNVGQHKLLLTTDVDKIAIRIIAISSLTRPAGRALLPVDAAL